MVIPEINGALVVKIWVCPRIAHLIQFPTRSQLLNSTPECVRYTFTVDNCMSSQPVFEQNHWLAFLSGLKSLPESLWDWCESCWVLRCGWQSSLPDLEHSGLYLRRLRVELSDYDPKVTAPFSSTTCATYINVTPHLSCLQLHYYWKSSELSTSVRNLQEC